MRLRTANTRVRRSEMKSRTVQWVSWSLRTRREYPRSRRRRNLRAAWGEDVKCRGCGGVTFRAFIEPNGLCCMCF